MTTKVGLSITTKVSLNIITDVDFDMTITVNINMTMDMGLNMTKSVCLEYDYGGGPHYNYECGLQYDYECGLTLPHWETTCFLNPRNHIKLWCPQPLFSIFWKILMAIFDIFLAFRLYFDLGILIFESGSSIWCPRCSSSSHF